MIYSRRERIGFRRKMFTYCLLLVSFVFLSMLAIRIFLSALLTFG